MNFDPVQEVRVADALRALESLIDEVPSRLLAIGEQASQLPPPGMKWWRKEVLGHLIDSAANNHHRFVRAQFQGEMTFPRYVQDEWIAAQGYRERPWGELVELWRLYNRHLIHVMRRVPAQALGHSCTVSDDEPDTLRDHMVDYVDHMRHHLDQILG